MRSAGAQKMTWGYVLSGAIALALLVYLVAALIRAEDL
jgi:K+-transporting ATPase KdpF subunit